MELEVPPFLLDLVQLHGVGQLVRPQGPQGPKGDNSSQELQVVPGPKHLQQRKNFREVNAGQLYTRPHHWAK